MQWELREATDRDCTLDDSGVYVVVHRIDARGLTPPVQVRADLMTIDGQPYVPIVSFVGTANNVRKHLLAYMVNDYQHGRTGPVSPEHASYIGYELARAESDPNYVQD